jgi:hypothetical protein
LHKKKAADLKPKCDQQRAAEAKAEHERQAAAAKAEQERQAAAAKAEQERQAAAAKAQATAEQNFLAGTKAMKFNGAYSCLYHMADTYGLSWNNLPCNDSRVPENLRAWFFVKNQIMTADGKLCWQGTPGKLPLPSGSIQLANCNPADPTQSFTIKSTSGGYLIQGKARTVEDFKANKDPSFAGCLAADAAVTDAGSDRMRDWVGLKPCNNSPKQVWTLVVADVGGLPPAPQPPKPAVQPPAPVPAPTVQAPKPVTPAPVPAPAPAQAPKPATPAPVAAATPADTDTMTAKDFDKCADEWMNIKKQAENLCLQKLQGLPVTGVDYRNKRGHCNAVIGGAVDYWNKYMGDPSSQYYKKYGTCKGALFGMNGALTDVKSMK